MRPTLRTTSHVLSLRSAAVRRRRLATAALGLATAATAAGLLVAGATTAQAATAPAASAPRSVLPVGDGLGINQQLTAPDGGSRAVMQGDGNFVVYDAANHPLWASATSGATGTTAVMQGDGNLVLVQGSTPRWATGTVGNPGATLALANGGTLGVQSRGALPLWTSRGGATGYGTDTVPTNGQLAAGQQEWSSNGRFTTVEQGDGNLVTYDTSSGRPLWASGTAGSGSGTRTVVQGDGNLVTYDASGRPLWNSQTSGVGPVRLVTQSDGNVVLYDASNHAVWSIVTGRITTQGAAIVARAASMQGQPYCWGGGTTSGPSHGSGGAGCGGGTVGFDCSGLALFAVYQATGIVLPHYTGGQATAGGTPIGSLAALQPGDLAFFGGSSGATSTHVAIYAGNGTFWDAATYGTPVGLRSAASESSIGQFDGGARFWH